MAAMGIRTALGREEDAGHSGGRTKEEEGGEGEEETEEREEGSGDLRRTRNGGFIAPL